MRTGRRISERAIQRRLHILPKTRLGYPLPYVLRRELMILAGAYTDLMDREKVARVSATVTGIAETYVLV